MSTAVQQYNGEARLYAKVSLNPALRYPLFGSTKFYSVRKNHYGMLRHCVVQLFSKAYYPLNVDIGEESIDGYTVLAAGSRHTDILLQLRIRVPLSLLENNHREQLDLEKMEHDILAYNMRPEFVRQVRLILL